MKLKYQFTITSLGDSSYAVPVGDSAAKFQGVLKVNDTAAAILELLREETDRDTMVWELCSRYDADAETVAPSVDSFLAQLQQEGLLA